MASSRDYGKLAFGGKSHQLALAVYRATSAFPKSQLYPLTSQMQRAEVSIPSNIAEGCGRGGEVELARFLSIAQGSASELEYQVLLAEDLGFLDDQSAKHIASLVVEVNRMINACLGKLRKQKADS